jgi:hypothetical protein
MRKLSLMVLAVAAIAAATSASYAAVAGATSVTVTHADQLHVLGRHTAEPHVDLVQGAAGASCSATVSGFVSGTFDDGPSEVTVNATGPRLAVTGSTCALIPNAPATTLTVSGGGNVVYAVTPATRILHV